jgi:voltage-gated potassium channel
MNGVIKKRIYTILQGAEEPTLASRCVGGFIVGLIVLNVLAVILETVQEFEKAHGGQLRAFEVFSVIIFTIEYGLRLWTCTEDPRYARPVSGRLRYVLTPLALIDLVAILPFYLPMFIRCDLRFLRALRLFRMFWLLKIGHYSRSLRLIGQIVKSKREELAVSGFAVIVLLVCASSAMYFIEHDAQPKVFSSIPASMWWAVVTLTTVGYGDIYPVTPLGKFVGAFVTLLGVATVALPAGILAAGFGAALDKRDTKSAKCPHCGKGLNSPTEKGSD